MFKSRKFDNGTKMIAIAPHYWIVLPFLAFYISFGVVAIALSVPKAMREPEH